MTDPKHISINDYHYELPESNIALFPSQERGNSNLLLAIGDNLAHTRFLNLNQHLPPGSSLIFNNTKVIRARIIFFKPTGASIELFLLEPHLPAEYQQNFESTGSCEWTCLVGKAKKWKNEPLRMMLTIDEESFELRAERLETLNGKYRIRFEWNSSKSFAEVLDFAGKIPLPPYIHRDVNSDDANRYQTVYSRLEGSVAAPTAGLHFTQAILDELKANQHPLLELTLHVGIGTFKPVSSEQMADHNMHTEHFVVTANFLQNLRSSKRNIAVGTTSLRTLESIYWLALQMQQDPNCRYVPQWIAYEQKAKLSQLEALDFLIDYLAQNRLNQLEASTSILIVPGYRFQFIHGLITNFHLPKSTLILLVAALVGEHWRKIYDYALENNFRFLSYGDSSLLLPQNLNPTP